jgi:type IV pilus assembly protein PilY1
MRWYQWSFPLFALASGLASARASAQAALDVQRPKPVVMLLVDTSGSMERMPGASTGQTDDLPQCTGDPTHDGAQRNRWAITLEALTGTFQNYSCRQEDRNSAKYAGKYDQGYYLPHYNFTSGPSDFTTIATQNSDGVIDAYATRVKFGLMTFDGVATTQGGPTLVPLSEWNSDTNFQNQVNGAAGMYSYGNVGQLYFPGCPTVYGVNQGARNASAPDGALIAASVDGDGIATVNNQVQQSLLSVRPFGGTPLAGMLDDLRYYLTTDSSVKTGSDPFARCRQRYAIVITDGAPDNTYQRYHCNAAGDSACNGSKCICPYASEADIAADLRNSELLEQLLVVAFDVDAATKQELDEIAQAGGSQGAIAATDIATLRQQLSGLLNGISSDAASRSVPQIVNNGLPASAGLKQYEITAGFRLGADADEPWSGMLYRQRFACDASTNQPVPVDIDDSQPGLDAFHVTLQSQSRNNQRDVVTVVPSPASGVNGTITSGLYADLPAKPATIQATNTLAPDGSKLKALTADTSVTTNQSTQGASATISTSLPQTTSGFLDSLPSSLFGDANGNKVAGEAADRQKIVRYVLGMPADASEGGQTMADIYHSNPVVLPPIAAGSQVIATSDAQLGAFLQNLATPKPSGSTDSTKLDVYGADGRPGVIFVGTNDGVLHAFNLDEWHDKNGNDYIAGHEFWGFVPPALFGKLAAAASPSHQTMFDGTPVVKNMMLYRGTTADPNLGQFATVLLAAVRGVPAYIALDVTTPDQEPKFLWQFSAADMGLTVATPTLTQALVYWDDPSTPRERAVAILPGGQGSAPTGCTSTALTSGTNQALFPGTVRSKVRCWNQLGRSLYVVDVATGTLLQHFDASHFPSPITGSVVVDSEGLGAASAAYFTDQDGVLWRLSMIDPSPSNWLVEPIWDLFHDESSANAYKKGRPAIWPPLLSRDTQGNYVILVGTGDVDNLVEQIDSSDPIKHRVVSLLETRTLTTAGAANVIGGTVTANWELELDVGESVTGPLSLFDKVLYFGTFLSPQTGDACDFGNSRIWGVDYLAVGSDGLPIGRWQTGTDSSGAPTYALHTDDGLIQNSLVLGVSIATDPVCVSALSSDSFALGKFRVAPGAQMGGGNYQIRALVSGSGGAQITQGLQGVGQFSQTLQVSHQASYIGFGGSVE